MIEKTNYFLFHNGYELYINFEDALASYFYCKVFESTVECFRLMTTNFNIELKPNKFFSKKAIRCSLERRPAKQYICIDNLVKEVIDKNKEVVEIISLLEGL